MSNQVQSKYTLVNQSQVSFNTNDRDSVTYSNRVATPIFGPKLVLQKTATPQTVGLDETITYTLSVSNVGNRATEVVLHDALSSETSFVKNSLLVNGVPQPGVSPGEGIPLGSLGAGEVIQVSFQVLVIALPQDLIVRNQSQANYFFNTVDRRRVEGSVRSNIVEVSILAQQFTVFLRANTEYTFLGDTILYTATVTNRGNVRMEQTLVTALIPVYGQFVAGSVVVDQFITPSANPNQGINIGSINVGATVQITFQVRMVSMPPTLSMDLHAQVQCQMTGNSLTQNSNIVVVKMMQSQITLTKRASVAAATKGDLIRYTIEIDNVNSFTVEGTLHDALPAGALFVLDSLEIDGKIMKGVQPSQGVKVGTIRAKTKMLVSFSVTVPMQLAGTPTMNWLNQAKLNYSYLMPDGRAIREVILSNTVTVALYAPIITLNVTAIPQVVERGDQVELRYEVRNLGNIEAEVTLTNLYPPGTELIPSGEVVVSSHTLEQQANQKLWIGKVLPNELIPTSLLVQVEETVETSIIKSFAFANYTYKVNDKVYQDQVRSNEYSIYIDDQYE